MPTPYLLITSTNQLSQALQFATDQQLGPTTPPHPDLTILNGEGEGLPIDAVRELKASLPYRPLQAKTRLIILCHLEMASIPAQNALLKTLEEPPAYLNIVVVTTSLSAILPTIQSRCQIIRLEEEEMDLGTAEEVAKKLVTASVSERLELAEEYKDREAGLLLVDQLLHYYHRSAESHRLKNLELLLKTKDYLQHNTNPQLTMEQLFLQLL